MLEAVDTACLEGQSVCDLCVLYGLRKGVQQKKSGKTATDIIQNIKWCGRKTMQQTTPRKRITCWMFSSRVKKRSWVWIQMKDPLRIILHFIAFCIAFYCQLDLQWENYTMLVFLFYYASVFDFPKYKKLYIALCHGRKCFLPWSIRTSLQKQTNLIWNCCSPNFPMFRYTCQWEKPQKQPVTTLINELE